MGAKDFKEHPMQCIPHALGHFYITEKQRKSDDELPLVLPMRSPGCVLCARAGARLHETLFDQPNTPERCWFAAPRIALHVHSCNHRSSTATVYSEGRKQNVITTTEVEAMLDSSTAGIGVSCLTPIK